MSHDAPKSADLRPALRFTVALVGLDGSGKTTVARRLAAEHPERIRYLYMGDNPRSATHALPTVRWRAEGDDAAEGGPPPADRPRPRRKGGPLRAVRKIAGIAHRVLDGAYRQLVARWYLWRGFVVVFDRHFLLDYHHGDERARAATSGLKRRLEALLRRGLYGRPDLVIVLDAPAEVAWERKREFSLPHLERRRAEYLGLRDVCPHTAVVDASQPPDVVVGEVDRVIAGFAERRAAGR